MSRIFIAEINGLVRRRNQLMRVARNYANSLAAPQGDADLEHWRREQRDLSVGRARSLNRKIVALRRAALVKYLIPVFTKVGRAKQEIDGIIVEALSPTEAKRKAEWYFLDRGYSRSKGYSLGPPLTED